MLRTLRKPLLIPALALALAALSGSNHAGSAARLPCLVHHRACPQPYLDCCCGLRLLCAGTDAECAAFCDG